MILSITITACGSKSGSLTLLLPDGAPLLSIASLDDNGVHSDDNGTFELSEAITKELGRPLSVHIAQNSDALIANLKKMRPELAILPINLAAKLYNENEKSPENQYKLLGVSTWGLNEIIANYDIASPKELLGKKIYAFGKSETPGIILRALLKKEGVEYVDFKDKVQPNAVNIVDFPAASDIVAELSKNLNEPSVAFLPQPIASAFELKTQGKYTAKLDFQALVSQAFNGLHYPQAGLVVRTDVADDANYADFLHKLSARVAKTASLLKENPEGVVKALKENFRSSALASTEAVVKALKSARLNVDFAPVFGSAQIDPGKTRQNVKEFLQILGDSGAGAMIGGKVPDDKFFALGQTK
jgi:NitT/TauT family transport system substrate-binding protein